jgi:MATE family multidrug resistance protein
MSSALDTLCSQAFTGSPDKFALGRHLQRGLFIQLMLSVFITILWWNTEALLLLLGQQPEIAKLSGIFARWLSIGLFPNLAGNCIIRYLQGQGIMKAGFYVMSIAAPLNILMQWVFVWSSFANLGAIGAPIATSITNVLICAMLILYAAFINGYQCWGGWEIKEITDFRKLHDFVKLGIPGIVMLCSEWWAFEIMALASGLLGELPLAAQTVMLSTCGVCYLIPLV